MMKYMEFQGKYYDVGTKVKIKTSYKGVQEAVFTRMSGKNPVFTGEFVWVNTIYTPVTILEILEPIEVTDVYVEKKPILQKGYPMDWDVEIGWIWYILIMLVSLIFKDWWIVWIFATVYFFTWKDGYFNGGNK